MNYSMEDLFGDAPLRPDHNDFWKLSDVVLDLDSQFDPPNQSDEQKDATFTALLERLGVDEASLVYMATQRAFRVCGVVTSADLLFQASEVGVVTGAWIDAFAAGVLFERKNPGGAEGT